MTSCKDCGPGGQRPAPHPGPRCATHHRAKLQASKAAAHSRRLGQVYSITADEYAEIFERQGRRCAICQRATGLRKRLAVDHDHTCCPGPTSCGRCVRGLLCHGCNDDLARVRDNPAKLRGLADYLEHWPSRDLGLLVVTE